MIPVVRPGATEALSPRTRADLARRQSRASGFTPRTKPIQTAWTAFGRTKSRREVATTLSAVFHGKCAYCEVFVARDVEHYYPKSGYPERMFRWDNFLLACKNCNADKRADFPMADGRAMLIDPCQDDPSAFIRWDLPTGRPIPTDDPAGAARANATLRVLPQLSHQALAEERRITSDRFQFLLLQAVSEAPAPPCVLSWLQDELDPARQWHSVRRQILRDAMWHGVIAAIKTRAPQLEALLDAVAA